MIAMTHLAPPTMEGGVVDPLDGSISQTSLPTLHTLEKISIAHGSQVTWPNFYPYIDF